MTFITSVRSSYGHTFMSTDSERDESCLICGGMWALVEVDHGTGDYVASNGDTATACTYDTSSVHGDGYCEQHDSFDNDCPHHAASRGCNCLFCA